MFKYYLIYQEDDESGEKAYLSSTNVGDIKFHRNWTVDPDEAIKFYDELEVTKLSEWFDAEIYEQD